MKVVHTLLVLGLIAILLSQAGASPSGTSTWRDRLDAHGVSRYERVGPLTVPVGENPKPASAKIREFVLDRWARRQSGHATITVHTKEGEPVTSQFVIRSNKNGDWHVELKIGRMLIDRRGWQDRRYKGKSFYEENIFDAHAVEEAKEKGTSLLVLKDRDGKVLVKW